MCESSKLQLISCRSCIFFSDCSAKPDNHLNFHTTIKYLKQRNFSAFTVMTELILCSNYKNCNSFSFNIKLQEKNSGSIFHTFPKMPQLSESGDDKIYLNPPLKV